MMSTDGILQRFYEIEKKQTDAYGFEIALEDENIVFRFTKRNVFWGKVGVAVSFGALASLIIFVCAQIYPVLFWLLYPCIYLAIRYAIGGTTTEQQTILFQINIPDRTITASATLSEKIDFQVQIETIREFYAWNIEHSSDSHNCSVRCTYGELQEVAIMSSLFTSLSSVQCALMLGDLCDKPVWERDFDGNLHQLIEDHDAKLTNSPVIEGSAGS